MGSSLSTNTSTVNKPTFCISTPTILKPLLRRNFFSSPPGQLVLNFEEFQRGFESGDLFSKDFDVFIDSDCEHDECDDDSSLDADDEEKTSSVQLLFRNRLGYDVTLCWVSYDGALKHYYRLPDKQDHIETGSLGHTFVAFRSNEELKKPFYAKDLKRKETVMAYRPTRQVSTRNGLNCTHIVSFNTTLTLFNPKGRPSCRLITQRSEPFDTSDKEYNKVECAGFTLMCEPGWDLVDPQFQKRFQSDLEGVSSRLPSHAVTKLKRDVKIWVNVSQMYGSSIAPTLGRYMCFHPEVGWLETNGMSKNKKHGIELYAVSDYLKDCSLWGIGGVMLHELAHAWHCIHVKDGYANEEIAKCFEEAMGKEIYEQVAVHGPQGPTAKAYASTNAMEYFAELSVAFFGNHDEEYNKWYPFNGKQLKEHDPKAFKLLKKLWGLQ